MIPNHREKRNISQVISENGMLLHAIVSFPKCLIVCFALEEYLEIH
jgi:hypothetical protein